MNYGHALGLKMEDVIWKLALEHAKKTSITHEESRRRFKPWEDGAKVLRVGEVVLIVDSDTIIPEARLFCAPNRKHATFSPRLSGPQT